MPSYYVALPFVQSDAGLMPGDAIECDNAHTAILAAKALAQRQEHPGAVAYSRRSDMQGEHFSDAVVLAKFGQVPSDLTNAVLICRSPRL
jgi:hypothetical protein